MNKLKEFFKNNMFLSITIVLLIVVIILVLIVEFNNNNDNLRPVSLYGYYYENVSKNSLDKDIYNFLDDENCLIEHESLMNSLDTLIIDESKTYCTFEIKKNNLIINLYDDEERSKLENTKTYKIDYTDSGIKLDDKEFLSDDNVDIKDNFISNYSLTCASNVAKNLGLKDRCTNWKKVSDGFYTYSCGLTIRIFLEDSAITYDTYNSKFEQFSEKGTCYKVVSNTNE